MTAPPSEGQPAREAEADRLHREARRVRALDELLRRRPDLAGVRPAVDLASESIRWCA